MNDERFQQQIDFILEIDKLKSVQRRTYLINEDRHENSAEHSWHLGLMAVLLAEYANEPVDVARVVRMVLIHDIVEVDAGDTYVYDPAGPGDKVERERQAAHRLFGLLPPDQAETFVVLWEEFEARETPEARFAASLDRVMPLLHNVYTKGRSWQEHAVVPGQVHERNRPSRDGSEVLWSYTESLIDLAEREGYFGADTSC